MFIAHLISAAFMVGSFIGGILVGVFEGWKLGLTVGLIGVGAAALFQIGNMIVGIKKLFD